jgi:hypothetical protein
MPEETTTTTTTTIDIQQPYCCRTVEASVETYLKYAEAVGLTIPGTTP